MKTFFVLFTFSCSVEKPITLARLDGYCNSVVFKKGNGFSLQNMFRHSYVIFSLQMFVVQFEFSLFNNFYIIKSCFKINLLISNFY